MTFTSQLQTLRQGPETASQWEAYDAIISRQAAGQSLPDDVAALNQLLRDLHVNDTLQVRLDLLLASLALVNQ